MHRKAWVQEQWLKSETFKTLFWAYISALLTSANGCILVLGCISKLVVLMVVSLSRLLFRMWNACSVGFIDTVIDLGIDYTPMKPLAPLAVCFWVTVLLHDKVPSDYTRSISLYIGRPNVSVDLWMHSAALISGLYKHNQCRNEFA